MESIDIKTARANGVAPELPAYARRKRGPFDAKNIFCVLNTPDSLLDLYDGWFSDPPFHHTYCNENAGVQSCEVAIGDIVQWYPQFKGWNQMHRIPRSGGMVVPDDTWCWYGIVGGYERFKNEEDVDKRYSEDGNDAEPAIESVFVMWLLSQTDVQEIYEGKRGEEMLCYKGSDELARILQSDELKHGDYLVSNQVDTMAPEGLIRTVPVKDVSVNEERNGRINVRLDLPLLIFSCADRELDFTDDSPDIPPYVSRREASYDLTLIEGEVAED